MSRSYRPSGAAARATSSMAARRAVQTQSSRLKLVRRASFRFWGVGLGPFLCQGETSVLSGTAAGFEALCAHLLVRPRSLSGPGTLSIQGHALTPRARAPAPWTFPAPPRGLRACRRQSARPRRALAAATESPARGPASPLRLPASLRYCDHTPPRCRAAGPGPMDARPGRAAAFLTRPWPRAALGLNFNGGARNSRWASTGSAG
jgi:hypothetical protein